MSIDTSLVGKKIKELREEKGLKQRELGEILDLSESYISYVEKGVRTLSSKSLQKLVIKFNLGNKYFSDGFSTIQFRADASENNPDCNYDKMMDDFFEYAKSKSK